MKKVEVTDLKVGVPDGVIVLLWWLLIRQSLEFDGHDAVNRIDDNLKYDRMKSEEVITTGSQNETNQTSKSIPLRCGNEDELPQRRCDEIVDHCPSD